MCSLCWEFLIQSKRNRCVHIACRACKAEINDAVAFVHAWAGQQPAWREGMMSVVGTTCRIGTTDAGFQFWRTCNGSNAYDSTFTKKRKNKRYLKSDYIKEVQRLSFDSTSSHKGWGGELSAKCCFFSSKFIFWGLSQLWWYLEMRPLGGN